MKCNHHEIFMMPKGSGYDYGVTCGRCARIWSLHSKNKRVVKFVKDNKIDLTKLPQLHPHFQPK